MWELIPEELRSLRQWVTWDYQGDKKIFKDKSNDPLTWKAFDQVKDYPRIAFVISPTDPYVGVDLDDCIVNGQPNDLASRILKAFWDRYGYAEVSPSGTGIKILVRGKKPPGARSVNRKLGIECYDSNRFWCMTGKAIDQADVIGQGQEAIDWLCSEYLSGTERATAAPRVEVYHPSSPSLRDRAKAYIAKVGPAAPGTRNTTAFSLAGHLHSLTGEYGERMSDAEVFDLMQEWNFRNEEPLDLNELHKAVVNGRCKGTPPADKPAQVGPPGFEIDLEALCRIPSEEDELTKDDYCTQMVPASGLLRDVYEFYRSNAIKFSPVFGLAGSVAFLEAITGQRVESPTGLRTNDYNLILAPTGSGKEAFQSCIATLLEAAGCPSLLVPEAVQSGNGLLNWMATNGNSFWVSDEFGKYLAAVLDKRGNKHLQDVGSLLLSLYGKSAGIYTGAAHSSGAKNILVNPSLTVLASSTASTIFEVVDESCLHDGLLGRIAFWTLEDRPKRQRMRKTDPNAGLVQQVRQWVEWRPLGPGNIPDNLPPAPKTLDWGFGAEDRWVVHAEEIDAKHEGESEAKAAIWARVAARSLKLAMVSRCSRIDQDPGSADWGRVQIELHDIDWGIQLSNWLARAACEAIQKRGVDKQVQRAVALLQSALAKCEKVKVRDIVRRSNLTKGDVAEAAKMLGLTHKRESPETGGPPADYYYQSGD